MALARDLKIQYQNTNSEVETMTIKYINPTSEISAIAAATKGVFACLTGSIIDIQLVETTSIKDADES